MNPPLFSVVVPVFDSAEYLRNCIESVLVQSFGDFEIIMVDDGSADDTKELVEQVAASDKRIDAIRIPHAGASAARNAGIERARGSFVMFVDSDDMLVMDALECIEKHLRDAPDMVWFGFRYLRDGGCVHEGERLKHACYASAAAALADWVRNDMLPISACNKVFRLSVIKRHGIRFREGVTFGEDRLFNLDFINHCERLMIIPDNLYVYRIREGSSSRSYAEGMLANMLMIHDERMKLLSSSIDSCATQEEISSFAAFDYVKSMQIAWLHLAEHYQALTRDDRARELKQYLVADISKKPGQRSLSRKRYAFQRLWLAGLRIAIRSRSLMPLRLMMGITCISRRG